MDRKWIIISVIALVVLSVLVVAYMNDNPSVSDNSGETILFNVSSGPLESGEVVDSIKKLPHFEGYDEETVKWMESLENKKIFIGNDAIVVMDGSDAGKIPQGPGITDVYIYNIFTADVIENHDLGNEFPTVYSVDNVKFVNQEIVGNGLA